MSMSNRPDTGERRSLQLLRNDINVACGPDFIEGPIAYLQGTAKCIVTVKGLAFSRHMQIVVSELARRRGERIPIEAFFTA